MSLLRAIGLKTGHLTAEERATLKRLEEKIQAGLVQLMDAGLALSAIRDQQLYREQFETFDAYCQARWKMTARRAYQLIEAAGVAENVNPGSHILTEKAARELAKLPRGEQIDAWDEAAGQVEPGEVVPARLVAETVEKRRPARRRKAKPKPIRLKVPGGLVIVEPRTRDTDISQLLRAALAKLETKAAA